VLPGGEQQGGRGAREGEPFPADVELDAETPPGLGTRVGGAIDRTEIDDREPGDRRHVQRGSVEPRRS
jgi:hypothetical protein